MGDIDVAGANYFTLALLVLLLLPIAVMTLERRRAPDLLYALVAAGGLGSSAWYAGWPGLGWSLASGLGVAVVIGGAITALRVQLRLRLLTGGQIKLMAAGASWLTPFGASLMIMIAALSMIAVVIWQHLQEKHSRPGPEIVVIVAIIIIAIKQYIVSP